MYPVNLIIEVRSQEELEALKAGFEILSDLVKTPSSDFDVKKLTGPHISTIPGMLKRQTLRLIDSSQEARVLINGNIVAVGTIEDMQSRYKTECGMHANSNITMQEWQDGQYKQTKARLLQKL